MITVPPAAIDLVKQFEGFRRVPKFDPERRAHPYICPAGYWTIGYGHLCDSKYAPITEVEAEDYLAQDLMTALAATLRYCPVLATEPEGRLAAIVDFAFKLGAGRLQMSTLRRRIIQRDWEGAVRELSKWILLCRKVDKQDEQSIGTERGGCRAVRERSVPRPRRILNEESLCQHREAREW